MLKIYTLSNCDRCRAATKWLRAEGIVFEEIAIRATPPSLAQLRTMLAAHGGEVRKLCNTSGRDYRELKLGEKLPASRPAAASRCWPATAIQNALDRPRRLTRGVDESPWRAVCRGHELSLETEPMKTMVRWLAYTGFPARRLSATGEAMLCVAARRGGRGSGGAAFSISADPAQTRRCVSWVAAVAGALRRQQCEGVAACSGGNITLVARGPVELRRPGNITAGRGGPAELDLGWRHQD